MTHNAPPRRIHAAGRPPRALGWGLLALAALGAAALALWALQGTRPGPAALGLALWLAVGASAWHGWRRWPQAQLEWDGRAWWLQGAPGGQDARPRALRAAPEVCWDGQGFVLLRVEPVGQRARWLWLAAAGSAAPWGDLRRAVYWRARPASNA